MMEYSKDVIDVFESLAKRISTASMHFCDIEATDAINSYSFADTLEDSSKALKEIYEKDKIEMSDEHPDFTTEEVEVGVAILALLDLSARHNLKTAQCVLALIREAEEVVGGPKA